MFVHFAFYQKIALCMGLLKSLKLEIYENITFKQGCNKMLNFVEYSLKNCVFSIQRTFT